MYKLEVVRPSWFRARRQGAHKLGHRHPWRFLAAGDSWFSLGTLNPFEYSNVLREIRLSQPACVVNCSVPGSGWNAMLDPQRHRSFHQMLHGSQARPWDALMVSAGGNDLLYRLKGAPPHAHRLLRSASERAAHQKDKLHLDEQADHLVHLHPEGLSLLRHDIAQRVQELIAHRDASPCAGIPVFLHTYAAMVPRFAPVLPGTRCWLAPALEAAGIPEGHWQHITSFLLRHMADTLESLAADQARYPGLHVVDTLSAPIRAADPASAKASGDWANETHLRPSGYRELGRHWAKKLETVLTMDPVSATVRADQDHPSAVQRFLFSSPMPRPDIRR